MTNYKRMKINIISKDNIIDGLKLGQEVQVKLIGDRYYSVDKYCFYSWQLKEII